MRWNMTMIAVGEQAPLFTMTNQDGNPVSLKDYTGKFVLMWWYPKADTPGWTIEGIGFRDRIQDFEEKNCAVLGVSFDLPADNKAFKEKFGFPYDLLSDGDKGASIQFGASDGSPGNASRVSVLIGPEGEIIKAYEKVTPADHPQQVLADLALV